MQESRKNQLRGSGAQDMITAKKQAWKKLSLERMWRGGLVAKGWGKGRGDKGPRGQRFHRKRRGG